MRLLTNLRLVSMDTQGAGYGVVEGAAIAIEGGRIAWCGAQAEMPARFGAFEACGLEDRLVTPALIDCHTHLVFGGDRAQEFELRLNGASYEQIAREGGGINATVAATRALDEEALLALALDRADRLIGEGVGTIEIKSGYGLTIEDEVKMLRVARRVGEERPLRVVTTYLAAHAVPPEYRDRAEDYLDEVVLPGLDAASEQKLVDAVDGFCETIAFSPAQIERLFLHAKVLGLPVKLHAEQLSDLGGAKLAARYEALSADHLEHLGSDGVQAMAAAGTVAVLLPGAFYALRETRSPPVDLLRSADVPIAIATDCNPGSSPLTSLLLAMNMAATLFRLTPEEALVGTTRNAARALGLNDTGMIRAGMRADLAIWNVTSPAELAYRIGFNPLHRRVFAGEITS